MMRVSLPRRSRSRLQRCCAGITEAGGTDEMQSSRGCTSAAFSTISPTSAFEVTNSAFKPPRASNCASMSAAEFVALVARRQAEKTAPRHSAARAAAGSPSPRPAPQVGDDFADHPMHFSLRGSSRLPARNSASTKRSDRHDHVVEGGRQRMGRGVFFAERRDLLAIQREEALIAPIAGRRSAVCRRAGHREMTGSGCICRAPRCRR